MKRRVVTTGVQGLVAALLVAAAVWMVVDRDSARGLFVVADSSATARRTLDDGVPVITASVTRMSDDRLIEAVGTAAARLSVDLRTEAEGRVRKVGFRAGERVTAGQELLSLDARQEQLALDLAETRHADAQRNVERLRALRARGSTPQVTLDDAETAAELARLERDQARLALSKRTMVAPFAGIMGIPQVDVGQRVGPDTSIASLDDRDVLLVGFSVPERFVPSLAPGQLVGAQTPALPNRAFDGTIRDIDSRIDVLNRSVRVRAELPNTGDLLRPGMSFTVTITVHGPTLPAAPELALQWERAGAYVWRVVDGAAEKVPVRLVTRRNGLALLEGALVPGDQVVVEGVQRLRPGRAVRRLEASEPGA
ncbi:MAG: efflux RND transporter periplasmic adaptor subunit [Pseudomonadota bacterium]|nr:efflux RND transporter periplasmic adaptor subunit [Pseudomonadota bacterium]